MMKRDGGQMILKWWRRLPSGNISRALGGWTVTVLFICVVSLSMYAVNYRIYRRPAELVLRSRLPFLEAETAVVQRSADGRQYREPHLEVRIRVLKHRLPSYLGGTLTCEHGTLRKVNSFASSNWPGGGVEGEPASSERHEFAFPLGDMRDQVEFSHRVVLFEPGQAVRGARVPFTFSDGSLVFGDLTFQALDHAPWEQTD